MLFTSALRGDHQGLLLLAPAHGGPCGQPEDVGLLRGEAGDGELPGVGAHLHRGPALSVPAVQPVGDLVAWPGTDGDGEKPLQTCVESALLMCADVFWSVL